MCPIQLFERKVTQKPWTPSRQIHLPDSTWKASKSLPPVECSLAAHWGTALTLQPCTCTLSPFPRPPPQLIKYCDLSDKGHLCSHKLDWRVSTGYLVNQEILHSSEQPKNWGGKSACGTPEYSERLGSTGGANLARGARKRAMWSLVCGQQWSSVPARVVCFPKHQTGREKWTVAAPSVFSLLCPWRCWPAPLYSVITSVCLYPSCKWDLINVCSPGVPMRL